MFRKKRFVLIVLPVLIAFLCLYFAHAVLANALQLETATTHTVCASGCDFSSIQAAIDAATPNDTLSLAGETFTEPFTLTKSLNIEGAGAQNTILQAAAAPGIASSRVVSVTEGVTATITGVTIRYGNISGSSWPGGYGGGILNQGALTLDLSNVISNSASYGGGIFNLVALTLTNSSIISNTAERGAGIYNNSGINSFNALNISNSTFEGNTGGLYGGGILNYNYTVLDISDSSFKNNRAENGGGIMNWKSIMTVTNCTFDSNIAAATGAFPVDGDEGGAIFNIDALSLATIIDSYFSNNDAFYGGAINNKNSGDLVIVGSEFYKNGRVQSGGAISNSGGGSVVNISESLITGNQASHGGGIYNVNSGRLFITDTTFYDNYSSGITNHKYARAVISRTTFVNNRSYDYGGAIKNYTGAEVVVTNSTFSDNSASSFGGAIYLTDASHGTATNVTISGNSADYGGGVYIVSYSVLNLNHSIIAGNVLGGDCYDLTYAPLNDLGYNLIEDGSCITDSTSFGGDPKLDPLQDNGGNTDTHALVEGSPALDAIPRELCAVTEDQRGIKRPSGSGCDIGAFELISSYDIFLPFVVIE